MVRARRSVRLTWRQGQALLTLLSFFFRSVITPSRTTASASAAVLRQEILDGSSAPIGSADLAAGADIAYSSQFLFLGQHFHAGVNEVLTIRNPGRVFFKWLLICRCDVRHGSSGSQPGPAAVGRASGNIAAILFSKPPWFFRRRGADRKKMLGVPGTGEGSILLRGRSSLT